jgi:hypothetical protein
MNSITPIKSGHIIILHHVVHKMDEIITSAISKLLLEGFKSSSPFPKLGIALLPLVKVIDVKCSNG